MTGLDLMADWQNRAFRRHKEELQRGRHDAECEFSAGDNFFLCNCSKRRREAAGFVKPPTDDLEFPPPSCPRCYVEVWHDGGCWRCDDCCLSWSSNGNGQSAEFTDDHGDLSRCEAHGLRGHFACQRATS